MLSEERDGPGGDKHPTPLVKNVKLWDTCDRNKGEERRQQKVTTQRCLWRKGNGNSQQEKSSVQQQNVNSGQKIFFRQKQDIANRPREKIS